MCLTLFGASIMYAQAGETPCYETVSHADLCSLVGVSAPGNPGSCGSQNIATGGAITHCPETQGIGSDNTAIRPKVTTCQACDLLVNPSTLNCDVLGACNDAGSTTHECYASGNPCSGGGGGGND